MVELGSEQREQAASSAPVREQHGFQRTKCGCAFCAAPCRYLPGSLDIADLERLCPPERDLLSWAEEHLRALTDKPCPTLVPARRADGACHWFYDGRCVVHANSPYGCSFFDTHMDRAEVERRRDATIKARQEDEVRDGLYYRVWKHLCRKGLIGRPGDRVGLEAEFRRLQGSARPTTDAGRLS